MTELREFKTGHNAVLYALVSLLGGGVCYSLWMGIFILTVRRNDPILEGFLWVTAPAITAAGFALGTLLMDRFTKTPKRSFSAIYKWPLIACVVGAVAVYWYGPMLIVFSMLGMGTISVFLQTWLLLNQKSHD